jgi:ribosomal protein L20
MFQGLIYQHPIKQSKMKQNSWLEYMQDRDLFNVSEDVMKDAKREWRRQYQNNWNREKQKKGNIVKVWFSKEEAEWIGMEAKRFGLPKTNFIYKLSLAHLQNTIIIPQEIALKKILQLLGLCFNGITDMKKGEATPYDIELFLLRLEELEKQFLQLYRHPPHLLKALQDQLKLDPTFAESVRSVM